MKQITEEQKQSIIKLYKMGWSAMSISRLKKMGSENVADVLRKQGIFKKFKN